MRFTVHPGNFFMVLFAFALTAAPAAAQSVAQPRSWTITPFFGTTLGMGDIDDAGIEVDLDSSLGIGVAVGYDWTANLGFEGEIAYLFDVAGEQNVVDWSLTNFGFNAVYHFDVRRFTPYATAGLGWERSSLDVTDPNLLALFADLSSTEVTFNFGGGVKYPINDRLHARGDVRRFQANDLAPDYWRLYGGLTWVLRR
jgi:opacity protein-like surface antigen